MVSLCGYEFNGPFITWVDLNTGGGVYLVISKLGDDNYAIDVGEAGNIRERVQTHDRKDCWEKKKNGILQYYQHLTPGKDQVYRIKVEKEVRKCLKPKCGEE